MNFTSWNSWRGEHVGRALDRLLGLGALDKAKAPNLAAPAVVDRLWINGLAAVEVASERVRVTMFHRLETTFRLLVDQGRWSSLEPPVAQVSPPRAAKAKRYLGFVQKWPRSTPQGKAP
jgi:hypothetical protein